MYNVFVIRVKEPDGNIVWFRYYDVDGKPVFTSEPIYASLLKHDYVQFYFSYLKEEYYNCSIAVRPETKEF